jgi:hypothetical protein
VKDLKHQGEPYAYCETFTAYRWHIRRLDDRGLKPSGISGKTASSLCGLHVAWDIDVRVEPVCNDACFRCQEMYKLLVEETGCRP